MRNAVVGGMLGALLACGVLVACGGARSGDDGGGNGGNPLVVGESLLAAAQIDGHATTPVVNRFVNGLGGTVTVTRADTGRYDVDFGFDVSDRYYTATPGRSGNLSIFLGYIVTVRPKAGEPSVLEVVVYDTGGGAPSDHGGFFLTVF